MRSAASGQPEPLMAQSWCTSSRGQFDCHGFFQKGIRVTIAKKFVRYVIPPAEAVRGNVPSDDDRHGLCGNRAALRLQFGDHGLRGTVVLNTAADDTAGVRLALRDHGHLGFDAFLTKFPVGFQRSSWLVLPCDDQRGGHVHKDGWQQTVINLSNYRAGLRHLARCAVA